MANMKTHIYKKPDEWETCEVICLKCLHRWIDVHPVTLLLKEIECPEGHVGYVIKTGQVT